MKHGHWKIQIKLCIISEEAWPLSLSQTNHTL